MDNQSKNFQNLEDKLPEGGKTILRGYVRRVRPEVEKVEVVLVTPGGQEFERIFPAEEFVEAGLHYENAPFNYEIWNEQGEIHSKVYYAPPTEEEKSEMPEVDLSVFDNF